MVVDSLMVEIGSVAVEDALEVISKLEGSEIEVEPEDISLLEIEVPDPELEEGGLVVSEFEVLWVSVSLLLEGAYVSEVEYCSVVDGEEESEPELALVDISLLEDT